MESILKKPHPVLFFFLVFQLKKKNLTEHIIWMVSHRNPAVLEMSTNLVIQIYITFFFFFAKRETEVGEFK